MAPPLMLTMSSDAPVSACQASTTEAHASLTSNAAMLSMLRPRGRVTRGYATQVQLAPPLELVLDMTMAPGKSRGHR